MSNALPLRGPDVSRWQQQWLINAGIEARIIHSSSVADVSFASLPGQQRIVSTLPAC